MGTIEQVPHQFCFLDKMTYPPSNDVDFEFFLSRKIVPEEIPDDWVYLPITFTAFFKANNFGNDPWAIKYLQCYIDSLDASKKYFTVVQFDLGVIVDLSRLNIKVFAMAGGVCDYRLPLICQPGRRIAKSKDIHCSFVGRRTHPIRDKVFSLNWKFTSYISDAHHSPDRYREILARSIFGLAPRGFSETSFRLQECLKNDAIPVYVSDVHFIPHGIPFDYGILVGEDQIDYLPEILGDISPQEIKRKQQMIPTVYASLYTFGANKNIILNQLKRW